jgi:hypothetical protein
MAMSRIDPGSPIAATVRLTGTNGGTRIDVVCSYSKSASKPADFGLVAVGPGGEQEQIGSWHAAPGAEGQMPALTHFGRGNLMRVVMVRSDGTVLLAYDVVP